MNTGTFIKAISIMTVYIYRLFRYTLALYILLLNNWLIDVVFIWRIEFAGSLVFTHRNETQRITNAYKSTLGPIHLVLYRILAPAATIDKSGTAAIFGNPAPAKFVAGFGGCQRSYSLVRLITDKTNAADLSSGVFAVLISVIPGRKKNTIFIAVPLHNFVKTGRERNNKV